MKLTRLQIQNIACFEDLTLDLTDERGNPASWVVLVGENGTGKSTILQMLSGIILGPPNIPGDLNWQSFCRPNSDNLWGLAKAYFLRESNDAHRERQLDGLHIELALLHPMSMPNHPYPQYSYAGVDRSMSHHMVNFEPPTYTTDTVGGWFSCGYGPWRRLFRRSSSDADGLPVLGDSYRAYRFSTIFGDESRLTPVSWIAELYVRTIHPDKTPADQEKFDQVIAAIEKVLPGVRFSRVTADQEVLVEEAGVEIPLARLSDGYRSTFTWMLDLVRRLFDAFPDSPDPLQESGVVLVDELDLHLHPKWQRRVVTDIRRLFPNLQFIVTTHSPFIAQDLTERDKIFVLERNNAGAVVARPAEGDSGAFADWSADQLYGRFFGLESGTEDESVLKQKAEYERLLDKEAANALTPAQQARQDRLRLRFSHAPLGPDATSDDYYRAADALFASLDVRRKPAKRAANGNGKNGKKAGDGAS